MVGWTLEASLNDWKSAATVELESFLRALFAAKVWKRSITSWSTLSSSSRESVVCCEGRDLKQAGFDSWKVDSDESFGEESGEAVSKDPEKVWWRVECMKKARKYEFEKNQLVQICIDCKVSSVLATGGYWGGRYNVSTSGVYAKLRLQSSFQYLSMNSFAMLGVILNLLTYMN